MRFSGDLKSYARILGMRGKDSVMLQHLGSALRRIDEGVFIRCLAEQVEDEKPACALIPDVRYKNEADWIKKQGGMLVRVVRTEPNGLQYVSSDRDPNHPSEAELNHYDGWGWYIDAPSGFMDTLRIEAERLVNAIRRRLGITSLGEEA